MDRRRRQAHIEYGTIPTTSSFACSASLFIVLQQLSRCTYRKSTYAHLALLLHQRTALHCVEFVSVSTDASKVSSEMPSSQRCCCWCCCDKRATPRAHWHQDTCSFYFSFYCSFLSAASTTHLRVGNERGPLCDGGGHWSYSRQRGEDRHDDVNDGWFPPRDRVHLMTRATRRACDGV